jgi:hypothetical protein
VNEGFSGISLLRAIQGSCMNETKFLLENGLTKKAEPMLPKDLQ